MADGGADRPPYDDALALGLWAWESRSLIYGKVTLAGGNPEAMTLRQFLDAAYALLVEEAQRLGIDLISALESHSKWAARSLLEAVNDTSIQNQRALAELEKMMSGVK